MARDDVEQNEQGGSTTASTTTTATARPVERVRSKFCCLKQEFENGASSKKDQETEIERASVIFLGVIVCILIKRPEEIRT